MTAEPLRTPQHTADRLQVTLRTAQRLMSSGAIRTTRAGVQLRTTDRWVDEYLERNATGGRGRARRGARAATALSLLAVLAGCGPSWHGLYEKAHQAQWDCQEQYSHAGDFGDNCGNTRPA